MIEYINESLKFELVTTSLGEFLKKCEITLTEMEIKTYPFFAFYSVKKENDLVGSISFWNHIVGDQSISILRYISIYKKNLLAEEVISSFINNVSANIKLPSVVYLDSADKSIIKASMNIGFKGVSDNWFYLQLNDEKTEILEQNPYAQ
jgi:hypothetical protein